jgi:hypothetical protein
VLEVRRQSQMKYVVATLKHWDRLGWVTWDTDQEISN